MFIAHLPSGYLLARCIKNKATAHLSSRLILFSALSGGIFPDLDLLYFYFIDNQQHNHHTYMSHIPLFWFIVFMMVSGLIVILRKKTLLAIWLVFMTGIFIHLILDTVTGGILWKYPLDMNYISFSTVENKYTWWVLNFILHWTFLFEIAILFAAITVYFRDRFNIYNKVKLN